MPDARLHVDAMFLAKQIARLCAEWPELAHDETLAHDMMEGATDLHDVVRRALNERDDATGMVESIKARKADLNERQRRFERRADAMERLIANLLDTAGLPKLTLPEATITPRSAIPHVEVDDLDALPQGYFKLARVADKRAILASLTRNEDVPGAHLEGGKPGITVRKK